MDLGNYEGLNIERPKGKPEAFWGILPNTAIGLNMFRGKVWQARAVLFKSSGS